MKTVRCGKEDKPQEKWFCFYNETKIWVSAYQPGCDFFFLETGDKICIIYIGTEQNTAIYLPAKNQITG